MRYTVLTPRTFHHRITKYLGVLVGAALVATLGLPSAVQAQTPNRPTPTYMVGSDTFTLTPAGAAYASLPCTIIGFMNTSRQAARQPGEL